MSLHTQETLLIGGEENFATVRHLVVRGTNYEIGKQRRALRSAYYSFRLQNE